MIGQERSWNSGGEYYYSRIKTRVFNLACYYEEITIEQREAIVRWLDRRTSGDLIFDDRKYASYHVRPTKKIEFKDYLQKNGVSGSEYYSGTFTIVFSAYDPFATLDASYSDYSSNRRAMAETGLIADSMMPTVPELDTITNFVMYNPGTETGHTIIRFSGYTGSSDMKITNNTTGDVCVLKAELDIPSNQYIEINSKTGRVELVSSHDGNRQLYFAFHDEGYIKLAPCMPFYRTVYVSTTAGSKAVTATSNIFSEDMVGQYIYLEGAWKYIGEFVSER